MGIADVFDRIWERLAEAGHCDSHGSCEYSRVLAEWFCLGQDQAIESFIKRRANIDALGNEPKEVDHAETE